MERNRILIAGIIFLAFLILLIYPAIHFFPGILIYIPGAEKYYQVDPDARFLEGQAITGEQALDILKISNSDMFVKEKLDHITGLATSKSNITGNILALRYLERNPEVSYGFFVPHYYKVLPAVEYITGNPGDKGINMYAYVDPDLGRVAYIGYTVRPGKVSGNYTYEPDVKGAQILTEYMASNVSVETLTNITIVDTGYNPSINLTETQEREFIAAAVDDRRVKYYLEGFEYIARINGGSYWWKDGTSRDYIIYYPSVEFLTKDIDQNWALFIRADVDPRHNTVAEFQRPSGIVKYN